MHIDRDLNQIGLRESPSLVALHIMHMIQVVEEAVLLLYQFDQVLLLIQPGSD